MFSEITTQFVFFRILLFIITLYFLLIYCFQKYSYNLKYFITLVSNYFLPFPCNTSMGHIIDGSGRVWSPRSTGGAKSKSTATSPSEADMREVCGPRFQMETSLPVPSSTLNSRKQFLSLVSTTM